MDDATPHADQLRAQGPLLSGPAQSDPWFDALLESAADAIVIVDKSGLIQIANREAERMFGYRRSELIGQPVELLVPTNQKGVHVRNRDRYMAEPKARPMGVGLDLSARRKDGGEFSVEISLSPMPGDDGLRIASVIRDVSSRRRLEDAALSARAMAAQEQERVRIAHDLHDELAQTLSGVALGLELVESATRLETAREQAKRLGEEVNDAIRELRRVIEHLRPDQLADVGLVAALERMAHDRQQANPGTEIVFRSGENDRRLHPEAEVGMYRVVQEALTNSINHADAKTIEIELTETGDFLVVTVRDDGAGFDVEERLTNGLGLRGMRERARLLDGELKIDSVAGRGTQVVLRLPWESA